MQSEAGVSVPACAAMYCNALPYMLDFIRLDVTLFAPYVIYDRSMPPCQHAILS